MIERNWDETAIEDLDEALESLRKLRRAQQHGATTKALDDFKASLERQRASKPRPSNSPG